MGIGNEMVFALQDMDPELLDDPIELVMKPMEMAQGALELRPIASTTSTASATPTLGVPTTAKETRQKQHARPRAAAGAREDAGETKEAERR